MKTTILSITAILVFGFYVLLITVAMFIEIVMLSYIFFPAFAKKIKQLKKYTVNNNHNKQLSLN